MVNHLTLARMRVRVGVIGAKLRLVVRFIQFEGSEHREKRLVGATLVVARLPADAQKTGATTRVAPTAGDVGGPSIPSD